MDKEQKVIRKLRAILSADVKGYSLLMTNDELTTIKTLKKYRIIMSEIIKDHSGRVVDALGDNMLAEFSSAVEAVQCSMEIQNELKARNADLLEDKRLEFRIGVNVGDVVQDGDSLYGEGVNIAARIEGLADSGGICISRNAYDHIKNKMKIGCEYIGEHTVKKALFHFVCVSHFYYLIATFGFSALKFKSPVSKKTTILKFRKVLNPLAFALAAWTMELRPSKIPLLICDFFHSRTPSQWFLIVLAALIIGPRRLWVAQKYHFFNKVSNSSSEEALYIS